VSRLTFQDFFPLPADGSPALGTPYFLTHRSDAAAITGIEVVRGSRLDPTYFLRLAARLNDHSAAFDQGTISFERTAAGSYPLVIADFQFRIADERDVRAEGFGFALLNTALYPDGPVTAEHSPEEPNFSDSLGIGFDIDQDSEGDFGDPNIRDGFANTVSVHFGRVIRQVNVTGITDLASGLWHHARVILRARNERSTVSVALTPPCGPPVRVIEDLEIPGLRPYEARAWFGARTGAQNHDLANVRVQYLEEHEAGVSFEKEQILVDENRKYAELTLTREGDTSGETAVTYWTSDLNAQAAYDYKPTCKRVVFAPGETRRTIEVPIWDDALEETLWDSVEWFADWVPESASESFAVSLGAASEGAYVLGPSHALVSIVDDESAAYHGAWGSLECSGIVGVHAYLLPTGKVLYADRLGNAALWSEDSPPVSVKGLGYNLFCNGGSFLGDGRLLLCGGHADPWGSPSHDGHGVKETAAFDPVTETWELLEPMNDDRWYPTVTTLSDGTALVISGSTSKNPDDTFVINLLPQVYLPDSDEYRDLDKAAAQPENESAHGPDLYPRMWALPDGKAIKVGSDLRNWVLDTADGGKWVQGPKMLTERPRTYGASVMLVRPDAAEIINLGGSVPPTSDVESIDARLLPGGEYTKLPRMLARRRHLSALALPDGRVLVSGGCRGASFSERPMRVTEIYANGAWAGLPRAAAPRCYHSFALLLPDGSVLTGGGGQGAGLSVSESTFQRYFPDYFYKPRPVLSSAPESVHYGVPFRIESPSRIARVTLNRLGAPTHAFDQNQRYVELPIVSSDGTSIGVTVPADGWSPPGDYLLFVVDDYGVPSEGRVVRVGQ
jgi:hypothetical protein